MTRPTPLAPLLERFFTDRLVHQRQVSPHTIASYRDTFRLLLKFAHARLHAPPARLSFEAVDAPLIGAFLDHLEKTRGLSVRSRNLRLTAIHSFFRYAAFETPAHAAQIQRVLAIPSKRFTRRQISFLTRPEIDALLRHAGSTRARASCSTCRTSTSSSRSRMGSCRWPIATAPVCTPGCFTRARRRFATSPPTRVISGPRSGSCASSTRGGRRWSGIPMSTASCRAGGLSPDHQRWIPPTHAGFFLPVKVLSRVFRGKFVEALRRAYDRHELDLSGGNEHLRAPLAWRSFVNALFETDWVVYAKPAFGGAPAVLRYLGRYTHRVAISNHRLLAFDGDHVTFTYKDYAHGDAHRTMTLTAMEFLRRFVQHILPRGFVRIRQSGFLANTCRGARIALARTLLAAPSIAHPSTDATAPTTTTQPAAAWACPRCGAAMIVGPILSALHLASVTLGFDTS